MKKSLILRTIIWLFFLHFSILTLQYQYFINQYMDKFNRSLELITDTHFVETLFNSSQFAITVVNLDSASRTYKYFVKLKIQDLKELNSFENGEELYKLMSSPVNYVFDEEDKQIVLKWLIVAQDYTKGCKCQINLKQISLNETEQLQFQVKILKNKIKFNNQKGPKEKEQIPKRRQESERGSSNWTRKEQTQKQNQFFEIDNQGRDSIKKIDDQNGSENSEEMRNDNNSNQNTPSFGRRSVNMRQSELTTLEVEAKKRSTKKIPRELRMLWKNYRNRYPRSSNSKESSEGSIKKKELSSAILKGNIQGTETQSDAYIKRRKFYSDSYFEDGSSGRGLESVTGLSINSKRRSQHEDSDSEERFEDQKNNHIEISSEDQQSQSLSGRNDNKQNDEQNSQIEQEEDSNKYSQQIGRHKGKPIQKKRCPNPYGRVGKKRGIELQKIKQLKIEEGVIFENRNRTKSKIQKLVDEAMQMEESPIITIEGGARIDYPDGSCYFGDINSNKRPHGQGTYTNRKQNWTYEGEWRNSKKNGHGRLKHGDGSSYEGNFIDNIKHGQGTEIYKNTERYTGSFRNNMREGFGQYYYRNGTIYKGAWSKNLKHGNGRQTTTDGFVYEAIWDHGMKHGEGIRTQPNKRRYKCIWKYGELMKEERLTQ